jgi:hypothetical protein
MVYRLATIFTTVVVVIVVELRNLGILWKRRNGATHVDPSIQRCCGR